MSDRLKTRRVRLSFVLIPFPTIIFCRDQIIHSLNASLEFRVPNEEETIPVLKKFTFVREDRHFVIKWYKRIKGGEVRLNLLRVGSDMNSMLGQGAA